LEVVRYARHAISKYIRELPLALPTPEICGLPLVLQPSNPGYGPDVAVAALERLVRARVNTGPQFFGASNWTDPQTRSVFRDAMTRFWSAKTSVLVFDEADPVGASMQALVLMRHLAAAVEWTSSTPSLLLFLLVFNGDGTLVPLEVNAVAAAKVTLRPLGTSRTKPPMLNFDAVFGFALAHAGVTKA
jgi:hypothetical protein